MWLDLMLMNNEQQLWDALELEKPMKRRQNSGIRTHAQIDPVTRSPEEQSGIRPMASESIRSTIQSSRRADSSQVHTRERKSRLKSDRDLAMMTVKLKLKRSLRNCGPRFKFDLEKMRDPQVADLFEATTGDQFAAFNLLEENIDYRTKNIHEALIDTVSEVLGKARKNKKPPWMTSDTLE